MGPGGHGCLWQDLTLYMNNMNILLAQSLPPDGRAIQRTIEEVDSNNEAKVAPAQTKIDNTVFYGLAAVLLIIIAIGAAAMLWTNHPIKPISAIPIRPKTKPKPKPLKKL